MELRQLNYFLTICETKNFTRAAEKLFVSQPALTNQIIALEEELGMRLFERTKKNVEITPAGEVFRSHALLVMSEVDSTLLHISEIKNIQKRNISLVVHPFLSRLYFRDVFSMLAEHCYGSSITFTNLSDSQLISQFSDKNYSLRLTLSVKGRSIKGQRILAYSKMVCVAQRTEALQGKNPIYIIPGNAGDLTNSLTNLLPGDSRICLAPFISCPEDYLVGDEYVIVMPEAILASNLPFAELNPPLMASIEVSGTDDDLITRLTPVLSEYFYNHGWEVD